MAAQPGCPEQPYLMLLALRLLSPGRSIDSSVQSSAPVGNPAAGKQEIPDKLYFRIGEVSRLAGVKAYVLRYWETEFPAIAPKKSGTGQRLYRRKDVELILEIKYLLYEKRFTIEGARKQSRIARKRSRPLSEVRKT